ncbi:hypothetical protein ACKWTF_014148 [Chironomus riparius]
MTVLITSSSCDNVKFNCDYSYQSFVASKDILCCKILPSLTILQEFTNINIINSKNMSNVHGFSARNQHILFLPRNINDSFPNLEALEIFGSGLKKISSSVLKRLENLNYLSLSHNKIESLGANLFQHNRKLKTIILNNNRINFIEPTAFKGLTELRILQMQNNYCISSAGSNILNVDNLIESSKINCSKVVRELSQKIQKLDEKFTKIFEGTSSESESISLWSKMKEWFKGYMNMNHRREGTTREGPIINHNEKLLNDSFKELMYNETIEQIISYVLKSINMTDIQQDISELKESIAGSQESRIKLRYLIFTLISLSLLTYLCSFIIMYYLYPKTGELVLNNEQNRISIENVYDDIPMRNV